MNIYAKINSKQYGIISYSYRLNNVSLDTKISHILSCVIATEDTITDSDTIEFYSDDVLIYTDPINEVFVNEFRTTIRSEKEVNIPVSKENTLDSLFYNSTRQLRTPLNFDIIPLDTLATPEGNFTAQTVTHYDFMSEITIG